MPRSLTPRSFAALLCAAVLATAPIASAQPAAEFQADLLQLDSGDGGAQTIAVVALSGYEPLMKDIGYLGGLVGRPDSAQAIQGMIALFTQGKGLVGLDQSRPWGVVVEANGAQFVPTICLPIDDLDAILQLAQAFGVASDDAGGGVTELSIPNSPAPLFAKSVGAWVYVSQTAESLDNAPADPTALLNDLIADYDLGVRLLAQNVPAFYKQLAIDGLRQGVEEGLEQEPNETDAEYAERKELTEAQMEQLLTMIEDLDKLTVGVAVNETIGPGVVIDVEATALAGSDLASQLTAMSNSITNFAGFQDDTATVSVNLAVQTPPELIEKYRQQNEAAMKILRKQMMDAIDEEEEIPNDEARELIKAGAGELFEAYKETALAGNADGAATIVLGADRMRLIGGLMIKSTDKVESALKKFAEAASGQPDFPGVNWDAASHAGVTFHTIDVPVPADEPEAQKLFGDKLEIAVGIGDERVYLAAGPGSMGALTAAIDDSAAKGPTPTKPVAMSISMKSLADFAAAFAEGEDAAGARLFADAFKDAGSDDHVRLVVESTDSGFRYRIQAEEGLLKAMGVLIEAGMRQAGGGGPFVPGGF